MNNEKDPMLQRYMDDIEQYELIDHDREKELADIIHNSDDPEKINMAKDELVLSNLKLVVKYSIEYYQQARMFPDAHISLMDLINEGNIGLMRAAELFKSEKGVNFSTYAYLSIQRRIKRAVKNSKMMRIPVKHFKYIAGLKKLEQEYDENKETLTDDIIKERLEMTDDMLYLIKRNKEPTLSMDELEEEIGDAFISSREDKVEPADEATSRIQLREYLYEKMKELKPNHRDILFMKFFGNKDMTLEEMGQRKGITRERVRQIIPQALRALKIKIMDEASKSRIENVSNSMNIWDDLRGSGVKNEDDN